MVRIAYLGLKKQKNKNKNTATLLHYRAYLQVQHAFSILAQIHGAGETASLATSKVHSN